MNKLRKRKLLMWL